MHHVVARVISTNKYIFFGLCALLIALPSLGLGVGGMTATVHADNVDCQINQVRKADNTCIAICVPPAAPSSSCANECTLGQVPDKDKCGVRTPPPQTDAALKNSCGGDCLIKRYINPLITFLAGSAALVATISIVIGGIQYASSADDPQKVSAAKSRMYNAVLGLLGFIFLWAFLQYIIPGGVF